jgi:two-component system sensor histidine kinase KdpD
MTASRLARLPRPWWVFLRYLLAGLGCLLTTVIATPLAPFLDLANVMMLFLLSVVLVAWRLGRGPAVLAAFLSVALFDFFFVPPRLTFAVADAQYVVTFVVLLAVALIIGQLTASLRHERNESLRRAEWLRALYEMARDLSAALHADQIVTVATRSVAATFGARVVVLLADDDGHVLPTAPHVDTTTAQFVFDYDSPMGGQVAGMPLYLPLRAPMRTRGVLALEPIPFHTLLPEQRRQLDSFVALIATALERVHYIEVAQDALVRIESERLRNSVLAALSHDLRTPLTALVGTAESLLHGRPSLAEQQRELAASIRDQGYRMASLVENLLDMARLQSGEVKLNRRWQPLEEVVGSALNGRREALAHHRVEIDLPAELPLLEFDALLIERVLTNLLENAAKYTPQGSTITLGTVVAGTEARVSVCDNGPGLSPGSEEAIFDKFTRGDRESATPGVGLGLAISRAIVEAHGGRIRANNGPAGGACFTFTLPLGHPPLLGELPDESEGEAAP